MANSNQKRLNRPIFKTEIDRFSLSVFETE